MHSNSILIILLGLVTLAIGGTDGENYFTNPASNDGINPVFTLGDEQVISWKTTLGVFNISMWQQSLVQQSAASQGNVYSKIHSTDKVTNFTWVVQLYGFDLDYSNVFFFWINSDQPDGFISSYFNITEPTSTSTSATSSATSTSTSTNSLESASSPSSSFSSAPSSSSGVTSTGKIALGVGIGLGVPVLAALAALIWLKARQPTKQAQMSGAVPNTAPYTFWPVMQEQHQHQSSSKTPPKEMPGTDPVKYCAELPSQR